jgi:SAM-dependent methyltransferase
MRYLNYFRYLAYNWNIQLALFIIRYEIKGEKKYQQNTIGINNLKQEIPNAQLVHASIYQPINYYSAELLFDQTYLEDTEGALLDLGCGMGRVFSIAAAYNFKHIIGVDFSQNLCNAATSNALNTQANYPHTKVEVICQDAGSYSIPANVTTIFLFNPFDDFVMKKVINNIEESIKINQRSIKILYANPLYKKLFLDAGYIETYYFKKLTYLEGSVLERNA